jgi:HK97 family phage major capsid protein
MAPKSIRELKQEKVTLFNQAKEIKEQADKESRSMTQEEQNNWNAVMDKWTALKQDIDQRERLEAMETEINGSESRSNLPDPEDDGAGGEQRGRVDVAKFPKRYQVAMRELQERGDFRMKPEYANVMNAFFRDGAMPRVNVRDLQISDGPKGGYIAPPPQFVAGLLMALDADLFFRQPGWATVITLNSTEGYEASLDADPDDFEWTTEVGELGYDDELEFGRRELKPTRLAKGIKISNELLRLAPSSEEIAIDRMRYKASGTMEKAYLTGSGAKQALGVYVASDMGIPTSRDVSTGNTQTAITLAGLTNAKYGLKAKYWREAKWLFSQDGIKQIATIEDDDGYPILSESVREGEPDTLRGIPYYMSEFNPNTFTTGQYVGILGAFRFYHIADSLTMTIQRLVELYSRTFQTGFHFNLYTDGMPVLAEAFVRVKLA